MFPKHSHKEYVARYLDKILCCHCNSNNIHTYARSDFIKTNQRTKVTVAEQKTDKGQADSGILSCTFGARPLWADSICCFSHGFKPSNPKINLEEGINLSLTPGECVLCMPLNEPWDLTMGLLKWLHLVSLCCIYAYCCAGNPKFTGFTSSTVIQFFICFIVFPKCIF